MQSHDKVLKEIGNSIKCSRIKRGLQRSDFAALLDVSIETVEEVEESGKVQLTMLVDICQVLNISPTSLLKN